MLNNSIMYTGDEIKNRRNVIANNILKSFQYSDEDQLQKARNVGEAHPNGKWVWTEYSAGKYDWRTPSKGQKKEPSVDRKEPLTSTVSVKDVFNEVSRMNPKESIVSSVGKFVDNQSRRLADSVRAEVLKNLDENSLAYKIAHDSDKFTEKQLWLISYELMKNDKYKKSLSVKQKELNDYLEYQKNRKYAKKEFKKQQKVGEKKKYEEAVSKYKDVESNQIVKHNIFGTGKVISQDNDTVTVFFEKHGEKKLLKRFAKIETI